MSVTHNERGQGFVPAASLHVVAVLGSSDVKVQCGPLGGFNESELGCFSRVNLTASRIPLDRVGRLRPADRKCLVLGSLGGNSGIF